MSRDSFTVGDGEAGHRLDHVLVLRFADRTRSSMGRFIRGGHVTVAGAQAKPGRVLKAGEVVAIEWPPEPTTEVAGEDIPLEVLYEDEHILVVVKPAGIVVHPACGHPSGTLVNALVARLGDVPEGDEPGRPGLVHRLDRGTSGVMVVAKNERALVRLQRQFHARKVEKTYLAVVVGRPDAASGRIDLALDRSRRDRKKMATVREGGREAHTRWRIKERLEGAALLEVDIETGRTHQIRVHLASAGHAVLGDRVYGGGRVASGLAAEVVELVRSFPRQALHAWRLAFTHPATGERLAFEAPLPADMVALIAALKRRT